MLEIRNYPKLLNLKKLCNDIEIDPLLDELQAGTDLWLADTSRQRKVRCQRHTQNIYLRAPRKPLPAGEKNSNNVHESRTTAVASRFPCAMTFCEAMAKSLKGELGRATLVKLLPNSRVYPHVDAGAYYKARDRFHLVLKSTQGSPLTCGIETVVMREGEVWAFNNKVKHWAENPSPISQIHLIFDIRPLTGNGLFASCAEGKKSVSVGNG